jgi:hypothetical protein
MFDTCPADKIGLCWKNAEVTTVDVDTWDELVGDD